LTAGYKATIKLQIKRLKEFWNTFKHSKRGLFGIGILVFYITIALAAPLLTPNDPLQTPSTTGAADFAVPVWFKSLPGGEKLNENFVLMDEPGFADITSLFEEWNFTTESDLVTLYYEPIKGNGSAAIVFRRKDPQELGGRVTAHLTKEFHWPYDPPPRFSCDITVFAEGTEKIPARVSFVIRKVGEDVKNLTYPIFWSEKIEKPVIWLKSKMSANVSEGEIKINPENFNRLGISGVEEIEVNYEGEIIKATVLSNETVPEDEVRISDSDLKSLGALEGDTLRLSTTKWIIPSPPIDSYDSDFKKKFEKPGEAVGYPEKDVFSEPADYVYDIWILFEDESETLRESMEVTIYLDDLNVRIYGEAYGLLGTDYMRRDIFAQFLYGARISLLVGLLAALLSVGIGLVVGIVAGYVGRAVDEVLMRFTDMLLVLPMLPLLIVLIAVPIPFLDRILPSLTGKIILVISILTWMGFARQVRSMTLSLKERPFIEAAKAVGASRFHIITRHILPNVMSLVYVSLALSVPTAITLEAAISWLGLYDPKVISWGRMLYDAQINEGIDRLWWIIPPGISIALVSVSFILLGYALDEILNPKLRRRR